MVKTCSKCKETKPISDFTRNNNAKDKLTSWCKSCCKIARDSYYQINKEKINLKQKEWRENNADYRKQKRLEKRREDPRKTILYSAKHRAIKKGLDFNLTLDDIIIPEICPVLGISLDLYQDTQKRSSPSLDRIDPKLGYTKDNVQVISWLANTMKQDADKEHLLKFAKWVFEKFKE